MPFFRTSRGLNWHYDVVGEGEDVLFIHGFGVSSKLWAGQVEHFKSMCRVITIDLPGHGQSAWAPVGLPQMAKDVSEILGHLSAEHVNIVSSSFGGLIALYLLKRDPWRIARMSFVGSLPKFARTEAYPAGLDIERIRKMSQQFDGDYSLILDIFFRSLFSRKDRESERFQWIKQFRKTDQVPQREALQSFLTILEKEDARDFLIYLNLRVQFITGTEDYIVPMPVMEWIEEMLPFANFDYLAGVGHFPFLTKPKEFNDLLEGFLTS